MSPRPRRKAAASTNGVLAGYCDMFENLFYNLLRSLVGSQDLESAYADLAPAVRKKTEDQLKVTARKAAEFYVSHWKDGKPPASAEETHALQRKAFAHALKEALPH